jgi:hypothetical protein
MADKKIETQELPSGKTASAVETDSGVSIKVGSGGIILESQDVYAFIRMLREVDLHFLKK